MTAEHPDGILTGAPPHVSGLRIRPTFGSTMLVIAAVGTGMVLVHVFVAARKTLAWVFATAIVAWLLSAIISLLGRWMPRAVAVILTVAAVASIGIGAWVGLGATVGNELRKTQKALPPAAAELEQRSETARQFRLADRVNALVGELDTRFGTRAAVSKAAGTAPVYVVSGVLLLFLIAYGPRYGAGALAQIADPERREVVATTLAHGSRRARDYLLVTSAQVLVVVVVASTAFRLLGLPAPFGLGLMVGWVGVVPSMGMVVGGLPAMLLAAVDSDRAVFVTVVALVLGLQLVEALVVRPRMEARTLTVGPALTLIIAIIGFEIYGFGGSVYAFAALVLGLAILDSRPAMARGEPVGL